MVKKLCVPSKKASITTKGIYQLAFNNSLQPSLLSTSANQKIIMANDAACSLFGYSKRTLLTKVIADLFNTGDEPFKNMLAQRNVTGSATAVVMAKRKGGLQLTCEVSSSVFADKTGIQRSIMTIVDKTESIRAQLSIDLEKENTTANDIIIAKSAQRIIDIKNRKIVTDNINLVKSGQKKIDIENKKTVNDNIRIAKKKQHGVDIKNKKIVANKISLAKSLQQKIDVRNKKTVSKNIAVALEKASDEKLLYQKQGRKQMLKEIGENFRLMFNASSDVLFDSDLVANTGMVNDAYQKEFGYKKKKNAQAKDWAQHIHADDKRAVMKDYRTMINSLEMEWKSAYRYVRLDGSIANVLSSRIILRDSDGKAFRMIGSMQDISKQRVLEQRLESEIKLKEVQISEAAEDARYTERSDIGKELHDNINQLLGASRMYLELAKRGGENSEMYLSRSSEYTLNAIEEIRKLTKGMTTDVIKSLGLCEAIDNIVNDTMQANPVTISWGCAHFKEDSVNDKFKLNVYRIVQEQLNNILKHARASRITISLLQNKQSIKLKIADNGIGFDVGKKQTGIGLANIRSRTESYNGIAEFSTTPGNGCMLTATFSIKDKLLERA